MHEVIDSTYREASQERRELLSHHTNISNVLSLLKALHVGSPYTRFSMWPRPISLLALDPGDPNLWYTELLRHRSSGLEGIQEFVIVVVVPKNTNFCITAHLKRFLLADQPPTPPNLGSGFYIKDLADLAMVLDHLYRRFPRGTPLDDLDAVVKVEPQSVYPHPVVSNWSISHLVAFAGPTPPETWGKSVVVMLEFASPATYTGKDPSTNSKGFTYSNSGFTTYKMLEEVHLEAIVAKYENDLARSPLERGVLLVKHTKLTTCFTSGEQHGVSVGSYAEEAWDGGIHIPPVPAGMEAGGGDGYQPDFVYPSQLKPFRAESAARQGRSAVARWNETQLAFSRHVESIRDWTPRPVDLTDSRMLNVLLSAVGRLGPSDSRNVRITELVDRLGLPEQARAQLLSSGLTTFRDLARYLSVAPAADPSPTQAVPVRRRGWRRRQERILRDIFAPPLDRATRDLVIAAIRSNWNAGSLRDQGTGEHG